MTGRTAEHDDGLDRETAERIRAHADELVAGWPPLTGPQRDVVRNAFRRASADQTSADNAA